MNTASRGIRSALRSPVRSGAIIIILTISISLILAMVAARANVQQKIQDIKRTTGTQVTISPAGIQGGLGGGNPLGSDDVQKIKTSAHVTSVATSLLDQLGTSDTNLTSSIELGNFGKRQLRFENREGNSTPAPNTNKIADFLARITITGTSQPTQSVASDKLTSGSMIDGNSTENVALVGKSLADKNHLSVGSTFTAYGATMTVKGIFSLGNMFQDSGVIVPLATLQTLTSQPGAITSATATIDSSENVATVVSNLKSSLGDKADIVSQEQLIDSSIKPLESIDNLTLGGLIGAALTSAVIILLTMVVVVRERRREIGVMKAIGGSTTKVISQFIVEALTITIISTALGFGLGVAISGPVTQSLAQQAQNPASGPGGGMRFGGGGLHQVKGQLGDNFRQITTSLSPAIFASSLGIILLITIIGSAVPAGMVARIRPAEVLRND